MNVDIDTAFNLFNLIAAGITALAGLGALIWGIVTYSTNRIYKNMSTELKSGHDLILAKLELFEERLVNMKINGSDYSHALNSKLEDFRQVMYAEFYRRDEAEKSFNEIKTKLDRLEQKIDLRSN